VGGRFGPEDQNYTCMNFLASCAGASVTSGVALKDATPHT